ncbi:MAG: Rrf2 family transcriptional regulator [Clostridiales bacterium]|nr:Rrf2 family transcriptional regulator [Clostridiales bacterium]
MKISTRARYGLKAMIDIALNEDKGAVSLNAIAERNGISENYLEQLIASLKKGGFVKSVRGAGGGYKLNMAAEDITVCQLLEALEGSLSLVECGDEGACGSGGCSGCTAKTVWKKLSTNLKETAGSITLKDLVAEE